MVSFQCDGCADTVKKPKLDQHRQKCWASFTCLDCSKTFQNQDYKSHTSCISEAEKYQGALYKGSKKADNKPKHSTPISTPQESPAPSPAGMSIHPSRLNQLETPGPAQSSFASRGGRGGAAAVVQGGRVGRGRFGQPLVSGENRLNPSIPMRSWGSPAVDSPAASVAGTDEVKSSQPKHVDAVGSDKKKRRKGDKGGTGSKANTKRPKTDDIAVTPVPNDVENAAVTNKKRKRSPSPVEPTTADPQELSDKTLKRIRKSAGKLETKTTTPIALEDWIKQLGDTKKEQVDAKDISRAVKVVFVDDKWVLRI